MGDLTQTEATKRKAWDRRCHLCGDKVWALWVEEIRHDCEEGAAHVTQCKRAMVKARQHAEIIKAGGLEKWVNANPGKEVAL